MDGLVLKEIGLNKERMTIGRRPSNDIQIDNLAISGEHAALVTILNDSFLEDLNSTNGTLVNGQTIKKHFLKDGDIVELGKYKLKYIADTAQPGYEKLRADPQMPPPGGETEHAPHPEETREPPAVPVPAGTPAAETAIGIVQVLNGANAGRKLELSKDLTTVGKPGRQVAAITRRPQGYFITHVEGASLPMVNGQTLDVQAHPLKDHDVIEIAGIKMEFFLKG
jgi:pSer/pThr/pTyr-binding forkhead associated (FHA) protein